MIQSERRGDSLHIKVSGRFDFNCHQQFRDAYESDDARRFVVDLADVQYLDSSALGMLLLLRERADASEQVGIVNCTPPVRKILEIANFQSIFSIS